MSAHPRLCHVKSELGLVDFLILQLGTLHQYVSFLPFQHWHQVCLTFYQLIAFFGPSYPLVLLFFQHLNSLSPLLLSSLISASCSCLQNTVNMSTLNKPVEPAVIPERISSLMAPSRQSALCTHKQRSVSAASRLSEMSVDSTTSDILDLKLAAMESELEYIQCVRDSLNEAKQTRRISHDAFQREIQPFLKSFRTSSASIQVLKTQRPLIIEDIDEEVSAKRQRIEGLVDQSLLEHAYRDAIISRVLGASAKQKGPKIDQPAFKKGVYAYYGVNEHCRPGFGWCHVLGTVLPQKNIKAAHLIPKSMTSKEVSHLFGVNDGVFGDPRNSENILFVAREMTDSYK